MAQMLSLLCPILVAVRIFPEMLMQLEMRFGFAGKDYGTGYLSVCKSLEVDAVEDTNDPQRGPVAVLQGWRLVSHRRAKGGWVPDNHVQARGLLVAGEVVTKFMLRFQKVRAQGIGDNATRNSIVGEDRAQIKLLSRGLLPVCEVFAEVLQNIIRLKKARPEDSFERLGLKADSNLGFDLDRKNRTIDYGNEEYPVLLFTMAMCCGEVARCLEVLSRWWPCLLPRCNTAYGLIRQADLIEILMSTLRGTSLLFADSELKTLREVSRQTRFQELCSLMQTVHLLKARLTDGYLKHKKETIRRCVHNACLYPSPPCASQVRLQPNYVYIPPPTYRCSGYNRTMRASFSPCPFATQVGTILGGGRTRGSLGKWRCVCPRPSCHRVLGVLRRRNRFKEQRRAKCIEFQIETSDSVWKVKFVAIKVKFGTKRNQIMVEVV